MNFKQAKFLLSAAKLSQLPPDIGAEVAFVGRSNVGKSSALNALTRQKNLAHTSKTPGRTQHINFFILDEHTRLVDLPGYGYAKVSRSIKERWQRILNQYLSTRRSLKGIILLMDIRHPLKEFDQTMLEWSQYYQIPLRILLTKADKLSYGTAKTVLLSLQKQLADYKNVSVQLFSSLKPLGLELLEAHLKQHLISIKKSPDLKRGV